VGAYANLESIKNQCSEGYTDGEVTQEQISPYRRIHSIVVLIFDTFKGQARIKILVAVSSPRLPNLGTDLLTD